MLLKAYKYRIYPNKDQAILLRKSIGCARMVYNWALGKKKSAYDTDKTNISHFDLIKLMKSELKDSDEYSWLNEVPAQGLQTSINNMNVAYTRFFRKQAKLPVFKKKRNGGSFTFPQGTNIYFGKRLIFLPKLGLVKTKIDREFQGKIKKSTVSLTPSGKFYCSILVETYDTCLDPKEITFSTALGIDLGLKDFAIFSDGTKIPNPKHLKKLEKKLKKKQRQLSKKKVGSKNRRKDSVRFAKIHEKIRNQRTDFLHKLSHQLTHDNQVDTIVLEDLNVKGMVRNHCLAKSISEASWSEFKTMLTYKCLWYGKNLLFIGRFEPSSKVCSNCGDINETLTLADRYWTCSECEMVHDRDINAAKNIRNFALIARDIGLEQPEFKPAETITNGQILDLVKLCL
jgi:putative transposase